MFFLFRKGKTWFPSILWRISEHFPSPSMTYTMMHNSSDLHLLIDPIAHLLSNFCIERFFFCIWIKFMFIPSLKEWVWIFKLDKERIHSNLRKPVDKISQILIRICSFNADSSVSETCCLLNRDFLFCPVVFGKNLEEFILSARTKISHAKFMEKTIHGNQYSHLRICLNLPLSSVEFDTDMIHICIFFFHDHFQICILLGCFFCLHL